MMFIDLLIGLGLIVVAVVFYSIGHAVGTHEARKGKS